MLNAADMKNHKAAKRGIGEKYVWKSPDDGTEKDECGHLAKVYN